MQSYKTPLKSLILTVFGYICVRVYWEFCTAELFNHRKNRLLDDKNSFFSFRKLAKQSQNLFQTIN